MMNIVYLNGQFIPKEDARISPDDRGFLFADGVYEVAKYYKGKAFRYQDHLDRLNRSLAEIQINFADTNKLEAIFEELIIRNNLADQDAGIYLQITRGGASSRSHFFPKNIEPTVYAYAFPFPSSVDKLENGIKVISREDIRWHRCDIKSVSLLPNTLLNNEAVENGALECVMVRDGYMTEGTHSSLFAVKDRVVITRPLSNLILPGITRKVVLEICKEDSIPFEERLFTKDELYQMDEVFLAGTGSEIMPVVEIDDKIIGNKKPGTITRLLQKKFFEKVAE